MSNDLLPPPLGAESDSEQRMREAINRFAAQMIQSLDGVISLRTASPDVKRARHVARGHLENFALHAMRAHRLSQQPSNTEE